MNDEIHSILTLLAEGTISVEEAQQLMDAVNRINTPPGQSAGSSSERSKVSSADTRVQFLRIKVNKQANDFRPEKEVNIRVPVSLMTSGMKLGSIIQGFGGERVQQKMRERGIDLSQLDAARLNEVLKKGELLLDVDDGKAHVQISCE
jgi:hypothetical protein